MPETLVVDASALVDALIGSSLGGAVRARLRGCELHAPAHLDAEVLSALGRLNRAGELEAAHVSAALHELAIAPIVRHRLTSLLAGAWSARDRFRLVDALYVKLSDALGAVLVTTDERRARSTPAAELIAGG